MSPAKTEELHIIGHLNGKLVVQCGKCAGEHHVSPTVAGALKAYMEHNCPKETDAH